MSYVLEFLGVTGMLIAGVLLLTRGLHQVRQRDLFRLWPVLRGTLNLTFGGSLLAGVAAYSLTFFIPE